MQRNIKKKLRVVLAAPPVDYLTDLYGIKAGKSYRSQPPLGIGYIASALMENGFDVVLFDCAAQGWDVGESANRILAADPDVVGVTAITFEAPSAYDLIREIKRRRDVYIVIGGAHANSYYPRIPSECGEIDAIVVGDGEATAVEFCKRISESPDVSLEGLPGLITKLANGHYSDLVERPPELDLDSISPPAYDLFPHRLYRPLPHRARLLPTSSMITSRGCSYRKCTYCELSGLVRKTYRRHSPGRVIEEMKTVKKVTMAKDIYFQDDIFISDPEWVRDFCEALSRNRLGIVWSCESRFTGVTPELLKTMKDAGCWRIYYGFESGSQHLLDGIQKGFTLDEARKAARAANEAGMEVVGFFMLGLPGETPEDARKTIDFSLELDLDHAFYTMTVPHPNTKLYELCKGAGIIVSENVYYYKKPSFIPKAYKDGHELVALRELAFRRFYYRPSYWWKCIKRIHRLPDIVYYFRGFVSLFRYFD